MKSVKILFVDDEEEILNAYEDLFSHNEDDFDLILNEISESKNTEYFQTKIDLANQGLIAVEKVKQSIKDKDPYMIAFIDMRMPPGINGAETIKMIREIDKEIEIVIVTAYSDISLNELTMETQAQDKILFLKKPFDGQEVIQLAKNLSSKYKLSRIKDEFLQNVSHELKTPLSSILGFSQLMIEDAKDDQIKEYANFVHTSAKLMSSLINDLLISIDLHHSTHEYYDKIPINIKPLIEEVFGMLKPLVKEKNLDFLIEFDDPNNEWNSLILEVNPLHLKQVFINLIQNAIKFTNKGYIKILIEINSSLVNFSIIDTGHGIPKDKIEDIFNKFTRLENAHHQIPGLGLGLSIVQKILLKHNASVKVSTKIDKGSNFKITFKR